MPKKDLNTSLHLPELYPYKPFEQLRKKQIFYLEKRSEFEVCPKCASICKSIYDRVEVTIKDTPIRDKRIILKIRKRRFRCKNCTAIFREPIQGIKKGFRTSDRFRRHIMWAANHFHSLKDVTRQLDCSFWLVYTAYYEQLRLQLQKIQNPWATTIGIDEHAFKKNKYKRYREFATIFVEYNHKRVREITLGRKPSELLACDRLNAIPGRENVKNVIIDMSKTYKKFVKDFFPNAKITADRFHVIRLFNQVVNQYRKLATGDKRKNPARLLLLKRYQDLEPHQKRAIRRFKKENPLVGEVHTFKERMHGIYRVKGYKRACELLIKLTDDMARSSIPEIRRLRQTIHQWREEITNYFRTKLTNGRTEGFNRKSKLIQRNAYGFKNFDNYRKRQCMKAASPNSCNLFGR